MICQSLLAFASRANAPIIRRTCAMACFRWNGRCWCLPWTDFDDFFRMHFCNVIRLHCNEIAPFWSCILWQCGPFREIHGFSHHFPRTSTTSSAILRGIREAIFVKFPPVTMNELSNPLSDFQPNRFVEFWMRRESLACIERLSRIARSLRGNSWGKPHTAKTHEPIFVIFSKTNLRLPKNNWWKFHSNRISYACVRAKANCDSPGKWLHCDLFQMKPQLKCSMNWLSSILAKFN